MSNYSLRAVFGMETTGFNTGVKEIRSKMNGLIEKWGKWVALAGATAFLKLSKDAIELAGAITDLSENLGVNAEAFQALEAQHKRNGVSQEQLVKAMEKTKGAVIDAVEGNKKAAEALAVLGLRAEKLINLPLEQQYEAIAKGAANAKNQNQAFAAVAAIFGDKVGPKLMGSLKELAAIGLPGVTQAAKDAGLVLNNETRTALDKAGDAIDDFKKRITVAVGNIIVNFRTEEGIKLLSLEMLKAVSVFSAKILQVPINLGQVLAATLFGTFEAAGGYLLNAGIDAVQGIAKAMNAVLPERFEINVGNLDQFRSDSKGFVDDIARNIAQTKPTAFVDAVAGGYDDLIAKQRAVVEELNKTDLKPATDALVRAGESVKESIVGGAVTLSKVKFGAPGTGSEQLDQITLATRDAQARGDTAEVKRLQDEFNAAREAEKSTVSTALTSLFGAVPDTSRLLSASDETLKEIVRRNAAKIAGIKASPISGVDVVTGGLGRKEQIVPFDLERAAAQRELDSRAKLRSAFASGGQSGVFRAFPNSDPLALERMINELVLNREDSARAADDLSAIRTGLAARGLIPKF